jgi:hypothetical protein
MKVFKTRTFHRFCLKSGVSDANLCDAIARLLRGQVDAELGSGLVKQRIARPNEGRSGGFRSVIVYLKGRSATFAFGFAKNERANISVTELASFKLFAETLQRFRQADWDRAVLLNELIEVKCDDEEKAK